MLMLLNKFNRHAYPFVFLYGTVHCTVYNSKGKLYRVHMSESKNRETIKYDGSNDLLRFNLRLGHGSQNTDISQLQAVTPNKLVL